MATVSLDVKLDKIRSNPKLENQQQVVLAAVEDTLRDQKSEFTPTAYFAALLSLLGQFIPSGKGIVNREVASAVVYLLDLVTPSVPTPLLRSKFSQILKSLATVLTHPDAEAPLLRASIGCLESLLLVQDSQAWALPQSEISPRRAVAGLLAIAVDHRPKVRKRAQEALSKVLKNPPPSPSVDHPAAAMCAETALMTLKVVVDQTQKQKRHNKDHTHGPHLMHALQLVKTVARASGGWPSRKIDALCEVLFGISKSSNEHLTMAAFEVFEVIFSGMTDEMSSVKLPRVLEAIADLQPAENDSQLLPPWLAVVSRGYDVAAQVNPEDTFQGLPETFRKISHFLSSMSHNVRISAAECLISFMVNCVPISVILEPTVFDEKVLESLAKIATDLLSVKFQSAWIEVFTVVSAMLDNLRWRSAPVLEHAVKIIGELRTHESFNGKTEADAVISKAIRAMGPDVVLRILPLNLDGSTGEPGRAWLLPLLRDAVSNASLSHFRSHLVPLSEKMFQRVLDHKGEKTTEIKIFETVVYQIWAILPGYCDLPVDLRTAFDQPFAEQISNLLYQRTELRSDLCRALQNLVDSNKDLPELFGPEAQLLHARVSVEQARENLEYLASFATNLLAVLFNVYTQTLPTYRAPILQCINAYLSITPEADIVETFGKIVTMLESSMTEESRTKPLGEKQEKRQPNGKNGSAMPPMSHTLMDLVTTIAVYLPRGSFIQLFSVASALLKCEDPNLQKKAYKIIPRLTESEVGRTALQERSAELQQLLLTTAETAPSAARKDRLAAITEVLKTLPDSDLHFIPSIIPEVVISTKEQNERARVSAYELLVAIGDRMKEGGMIQNSKVPHMPADSPAVAATLDEYITMVSAGLAGTSPHSISATVLATTRILHEFHQALSESTINELVETMDIFLRNPNREIVRSVLGFIKCCVLDLPESYMVPRLDTIIPNLLAYEHEHKGALQAKVKHIFERMIRKYGFATVEKHTPEQGRKLINHIRKTKERAKRKKRDDQGSLQSAEDPEAAAAVAAQAKAHKQRFGDAFNEAVYGGDDGSSEEDSDASDNEVLGRAIQGNASNSRKHQGSETYIIEDEDEPLDLLDRKALSRISSTRPLGKSQQPQKRKARIDLDGKLVINEDEAENSSMRDANELDPDLDHGDGSLEVGISAYVAAIRGKDAARRGKQGKLKFSNKPTHDHDDDADEAAVTDNFKSLKVKGRRDLKPRGSPVGGMKKARMQRRGLGGERQHKQKERDRTLSGRVQKTRGGSSRARRGGR